MRGRMSESPQAVLQQQQQQKMQCMGVKFISYFFYLPLYLTLSQMTDIYSSKLKEFADDNFKFDEMAESLSKG